MMTGLKSGRSRGIRQKENTEKGRGGEGRDAPLRKIGMQGGGGG